MATLVLAEGAPQLIPARESSDWNVWAATFGTGLRKTLLAYRDGAKMVAATRLTNTEYIKTMERIGARLIESGLTLRQTVVLLGTIYNYTLSFVMEEQAVFPAPTSDPPTTTSPRETPGSIPNSSPSPAKAAPSSSTTSTAATKKASTSCSEA